MSLIPENDKNPYTFSNIYNPHSKSTAVRKLFSQSNDSCEDDTNEEPGTFQVYLRIKPNPDYRNTIKILDGSKLICKPPITSKVYKSSENAEYTFSKIFGPETTQSEVFEETVLPCVYDLIRSHSSLIFSYGTTNAGKTYTVQGDTRNPGLIPRTLHSIFSRITPDAEVKFAPQFATHVKKLDMAESTNAIIQKEDILRMHASMRNKGGVYPNEICYEYEQLSKSFEDYSYNEAFVLPTCSVWVSFIEIYNEVIYDLLEPYNGISRPQLKLCADNHKNYYVKGLKEYCVQSAAEAYSIYLFGKKNLNVACTKMNENSSRSHCIFVIKLLNQSDPEFVTISNLSICDLAGTERQTKTQNTGARLKESGNINLSLFTLNRCLKTLRENQSGNPAQVMPYRSSKLTQLLCSALLDKNEEKVIMIVNINPAQELYDETQQVLKVCAIACEIRSKPLSLRNVRYKTRFSSLVYENGTETIENDAEITDCEDNDEFVQSLHEQISNLSEEVKKKNDIIDQMHTAYQQMLEDSNKFHVEEVEEIRNELKGHHERRVKTLKEYYEWKIQELENNIKETESKLSESESKLVHEKEKNRNLEDLLNQAKKDYKTLDDELGAVVSKFSTCREQNKVYELNVDNLEHIVETLQLELEAKDREISDKSNHIQYLENIVGDKENLKLKKLKEKKKKLLNPEDEVIILSPDNFDSDRDVFRENRTRSEIATPAKTVQSHRKKKPF